MPYSVIHLHPREVVIEYCEACGLTHAHEETDCVASKDGHCHCLHWWDAEGVKGGRKL